MFEDLWAKRIKTELLFKLSNLNSNLALTLALENRIKLRSFRLNLRFPLEAHKKRLVKSNYNILASFSEFLDL